MKDNSLDNLRSLNYTPATGPLRKLRIKLEEDTNAATGAMLETKYLDLTFPLAVCVLDLFDLPTLFADKLHALLCREYLKGRAVDRAAARQALEGFGYLAVPGGPIRPPQHREMVRS